jgi:hypothetical protein
MNDDEYERQARAHAEQFGRQMEHLRTQVFRDSYRQWGHRLGLSASYTQKMSAGQVGVPKRRTVVEIADKLGIEPGKLLLSAGYVPFGEDATAGDASAFGLLLAQLDDEQRAAVLAYISHVRDQGIRKKT